MSSNDFVYGWSDGVLVAEYGGRQGAIEYLQVLQLAEEESVDGVDAARKAIVTSAGGCERRRCESNGLPSGKTLANLQEGQGTAKTRWMLPTVVDGRFLDWPETWTSSRQIEELRGGGFRCDAMRFMRGTVKSRRGAARRNSSDLVIRHLGSLHACALAQAGERFSGWNRLRESVFTERRVLSRSDPEEVRRHREGESHFI